MRRGTLGTLAALLIATFITVPTASAHAASGCQAQHKISTRECAALVAIARANPHAGALKHWRGPAHPCTGPYRCWNAHVKGITICSHTARFSNCPRGRAFTKLPAAVGNLTKVRRFELFGTHVRSLPDAFGNLTKLEWLRLRNNRLTSLPRTIGNLVQLWELTAAHNRLHGNITSWAKPLSHVSLKVLDLSHNGCMTVHDHPAVKQWLARHAPHWQAGCS